MLSENFLLGSLIFRTWVEVGGLSGHLLVLLQIQNIETKPTTSFKFNPSWLLEEYYHKMTGDTQRPLEANPNITFMKQLSENLQKVKKVTKPWDRVYTANKQKQLNEVENSLKEIYEKTNSGIFTEEELKEVREKELKREELLAREEELLRIKRRTIWIK